MAAQNDFPAERPPDFRSSVTQGLAGAVDFNALAKTYDWIVAAIVSGLSKVINVVIEAAAAIAGTLALAIVKGEDRSQDAFGKLAAIAIEDVFGVQVDPASMNNRGGRGGRAGAADAIGRGVMDSLTSGAGSAAGGELQPSAAGAEHYVTAVTQMALEGWLEGWMIEALSLGQMETFGELDDIMAQVLGLGRMSRSVIRPIMDARVIKPFQWQVNKTYRPELLGAAEVIRQMTRGRWSRERGFEELARQGFSDERIEALIATSTKTLSLDDALVLLRIGKWTPADVVELLRLQGYEESTAQALLSASLEKRLLAIRDDSLSALRTSYVNREIDDFEFSKFLEAIVLDPGERAAYEVAAQTSRELNVTLLSHGEVKDAVKAGILAFKDYREWLVRRGYSADDALTLELLLRAEDDKQQSIAEHRAQAEAERAAAKAAKLAAAEERRREVEADRALRRRGSLGDLNRAVVRGLIPLSRLQEVLSAEYDADTVQILVGLVEDDRQTFLAQQAQADAAKQRAARRTIDLGAIEQAVFAGVLTVDDYRQRLTALNFAGDDIAILAETLAAKLADRERAKQDRARADLAARKKTIDLGRFEQLVRRGVRTLPQYDALLAELGFDDAARAGMDELLRLKIADDEAAAAARKAAEPGLQAKGVSLEQFRRAVLLGVRTIEDFQAFLVAEQFTADAQEIIMAELRDDLDQAEAARSRRAQTETPPGSRALPLATIRRAVQLGIIGPDTYQLRLIEAGYSSDDVAIEMDVLLQEIADVQAARARREILNAEAESRDLSLSQIERAVRVHVASLDDYRARAQSLGYSVNDVYTLTSTLQQELQVNADAAARHGTIDGELKARNLSLGQLDDAVTNGLMTLETYASRILELGYDDSDAELLVSLLVLQLEAKNPAA